MNAHHDLTSDDVTPTCGARILETWRSSYRLRAFSVAVAVGIVFSFTLGCQPRYQKKPIRSGKSRNTWEKVNRQQGKWFAETTLAAYEKHGQRSEKWDPQAKAYLAGLAESFTQPCDEDMLRRRYQLGKELLESGCSDPVVLYFHGNITHRLEDPEAAQILFESLERLEASQYPARYRFYAARRLNWCPSRPRMFIGKDETRYLAQAAADPDFSNGNQRSYIRDFLIGWDDDCSMAPRAADFIEEFDKLANVDPWIEHMVRGRYHTGLGWKARGGGWASTVSREGWKVFHKELKIARDHFTQAHALHPEFPEAATQMISVSMLLRGSTTPREWFDRAVAAQFDYLPAYRRLLWSLEPRWGGSHREMYRFGSECLDTKRFDTEVPRFFLTVVWDVGLELDDWRDAYKRPGIYAQMQTFFESTLAEPSRAESQDYFKSLYGITAVGQQANTRTPVGCSTSWAKRQTPARFRSFNLEKDFVVSDAFYRAGPLAKTYAKAEELFADDQSLGALPLFEKLCQKLPEDPRHSWVPRDRVATLRFKKDFLAGNWVDLLPGDDYVGWDDLGGDWSIGPDGELKGSSTENEREILLVNKTRIEDNYEIRGEIESEVDPGIVLRYRDESGPQFGSFGIDSKRRETLLVREFSQRGWMVRKGHYKTANHFLLQLWDSEGTAYLNDEPIILAVDIGPLEFPDNGRVGFGCYNYTEGGFVAKYRNVQIRRLNEKPKRPEENNAEAAQAADEDR